MDRITVSTRQTRRHAWITRVDWPADKFAHGIAGASIVARDLLAAHAKLGETAAEAVVIEFADGVEPASITGRRGHVNYGSVRRWFGDAYTRGITGIAYPSLAGPQA